MRARLTPKGLKIGPELRNVFSGLNSTNHRSVQAVRAGRVDRTTRFVDVLANYQASVVDYLINCRKGGITIKLPNAKDCPGSRFQVKDTLGNATASPITVSPTGGQTLDGASSQNLSSNYAAIMVRSTGKAWVSDT